MTAPAEVGPFSPAYMESPDGRSDAAEPTACAIPEFVDDELMAIFGDEMQEVIETLDSMVPDWPEHSDDDERLREIRRCFHTLKGSGRVVGANQIGELAWCVERVLNRVIDGSLDMSLEIIEQVREIGGALPSLRAGYLAREPMIEVGRFIERMDELGA